jgi:hypothetical protein
MTRMLSSSAQAPRDPSFKDTDAAALRAIAQASVDVELFTIPLYMTSLYSIEGMHQITGQGNDFYKGRLWPGAKSSADPKTANEKAFNIVFSVFIQEMLHLQMAANMATVIGVLPDFTSAALQNPNHGWTCYGPSNSIIPNIIDLKDTKNENVAVDIGPLDQARLDLFLAIEQPEEDAKKAIKQGKEDDYFPKAPFTDWEAGQPLPMFGTIGWMYQCYYDYLSLRYDDDSSLWDHVFVQGAVQNDLFNFFSSPGHPMREFMGFETTIATTESGIAFEQMVGMMDAITDQGEGSLIKRRPQLLQKVKPKYCPNDDALKSDYPSYDDKGAQVPSADAVARFDNDGNDHYERFQLVQSMLGEITTWATAGRAGKWTAAELQTPDYDGSNPYKLPTPEQIADALNALAADHGSKALLSQAATGAIAGVTTVLNDYWAKSGGQFPFPSMVGSGDRMSIAWAVLGTTPDLSQGLDPISQTTLYHACQSLDFSAAGDNSCAAVEIFHSCRGSNSCKAQGGCGFVQATTGGGSCGGSGVRAEAAAGGSTCGSGGGGSVCGSGGGGICGASSGTAVSMRSYGGLCGGPPPPPSKLYSAPSDNKCGTLGGCAVPISASQIFPSSGTMQLFAFIPGSPGSWKSDPFATMQYEKGEKVHDVAYRGYVQVMKERGKEVPPDPPPPDVLRLAFPPST